MGASFGNGGELCGRPTLPRHRLQSQRMVAPGQDVRVEAGRRRLLSEARHTQTDLGAGTGPQLAGEAAGRATAAGLGGGGSQCSTALRPNGQGDTRADGRHPEDLPEFRRRQALLYPVAGPVCLVVMAMAARARRRADDLADSADMLGQAQLRALGFRRDQRALLYRSPKRTTFIRLVASVDAAVLERVLLQWQQRLCGPAQDNLVIVDGKKLRHGGVWIVNATTGNGQYLGGVLTSSKSNEIPAARQLPGLLDLEGKIVLADATHTRTRTAQAILHEKGGDYLMTVKGNQSTLQTTLQDLFDKQVPPPKERLRRRAVRRERNCGRLEIRSLQCLKTTPAQTGFPGARLAARLETRVRRAGKWTRVVVFLITSLTFEQLEAAGLLRLKRNHWVIESHPHNCLDMTMGEKFNRVRTPNSALVLGMIRRVVLSLSDAAVDLTLKAHPQTKFNTKKFQQSFRSARGGRQRLHALIFAKTPAVLDLQK